MAQHTHLGRSAAAWLTALAMPVTAQSFEDNQTQIPTGMPANNSWSENVDFADIDGDGDLDAVFADGGYLDDRNRLWINRGGLQGGTAGFFVDRTGTRLPNVRDSSWDVDFVDVDLDGDPDLHVSNVSDTVNQNNRWLINQGGSQGGTAGFFLEETQARWVNLGINDGTTTFSSIAPSQVLFQGGFIDWSADSAFADLDNDGDLDLVHTTYSAFFSGTVPTRLFLNDGGGFYEEFNPSGFQLTTSSIANGDPGLWCEGLQSGSTGNTTGAFCDIAATPLGVELGDLDGDFDVDLLLGSRHPEPRVFTNRFAELGGTLALRDQTSLALPHYVTHTGSYEQELGDLDDDGDLDLYGINWQVSLDDVVSRNDGSGVFGTFVSPANSVDDDNEAEFLDYDADGALDVYVVDYGKQTTLDRLYRNAGPPSYSYGDVSASELPMSPSRPGYGADAADLDGDGDQDLFVANDVLPNQFLKNIGNVADTHAPRIPKLEQAPARQASGVPTVVRAQVYDNASWAWYRYDAVALEYAVNGGAFASAPMLYSGGQIFRGEIPGNLIGTIGYRVRATDPTGNVGLSGTQTFSASCGGGALSYCTAGTTTNGCTALLSSSGTPSLSNAGPFTITATGVEGGKQGLIFYGISGRNASSWGAGTSFLCVKAPTQRTPVQNSGGTSGACDGSYALDWNGYVAANPLKAIHQALTVGATVDAQAWFRDPPAAKTTNLSDAVEFVVCP